MSVEQFSKLKEIDSLTKMRNSHLRVKSEQEDRVSKLNIRRQDAISQTAKLKQTVVSTNNDLAEIEKKISLFAEQRQRLIDIGGDDKKIASYEEDINTHEMQGLDLITKIEESEKEIQELKTFIQGLDITISDIQQEVESELAKIKTEVSNIDLRIELLMNELPSDFQALLKKISAKNLAHGPFTRIEQGSCYFCRFKISRIEESEIDMLKSLKVCPQCSRIFLPYGS